MAVILSPSGGDDAPQINAAIAGLPSTGGTVTLSAATVPYKLNSSIGLRSGVMLEGEGMPGLVPGITWLTGPVQLLWQGGSNPMISFAPGTQGWAVHNIGFQGNNTTNRALDISGASAGDMQNISIVAAICGVYLTNGGTFGSIHNASRNLNIYLAPAAGAMGIVMTGTPAQNANACFNQFDNTFISLQGTAAQFGLYHQFSDTNLFNGLHFAGGANSSTLVLFDYSVGANMPSANGFIDIDTGGNQNPAQIQYRNAGTPGTWARTNWIKGIGKLNGGTVPNLANLSATA